MPLSRRWRGRRHAWIGLGRACGLLRRRATSSRSSIRSAASMQSCRTPVWFGSPVTVRSATRRIGRRFVSQSAPESASSRGGRRAHELSSSVRARCSRSASTGWPASSLQIRDEHQSPPFALEAVAARDRRSAAKASRLLAATLMVKRVPAKQRTGPGHRAVSPSNTALSACHTQGTDQVDLSTSTAGSPRAARFAGSRRYRRNAKIRPTDWVDAQILLSRSGSKRNVAVK